MQQVLAAINALFRRVPDLKVAGESSRKSLGEFKQSLASERYECLQPTASDRWTEGYLRRTELGEEHHYFEGERLHFGLGHMRSRFYYRNYADVTPQVQLHSRIELGDSPNKDFFVELIQGDKLNVMNNHSSELNIRVPGFGLMNQDRINQFERAVGEHGFWIEFDQTGLVHGGPKFTFGTGKKGNALTSALGSIDDDGFTFYDALKRKEQVLAFIKIALGLEDKRQLPS